jgi:hypothetical protein
MDGIDWRIVAELLCGLAAFFLGRAKRSRAEVQRERKRKADEADD